MVINYFAGLSRPSSGRENPNRIVVTSGWSGRLANHRRYARSLKPDIFVYANHHTAEVQFATSTMPFQIFMAAMLLEMHKEVIELGD